MNFTTDSKILIQGIVEPISLAYTPVMKAYGSPIVAGVSAGHGGESLAEIPIFDLVSQAVEEFGSIDTTVICTDPHVALDAALEAIAAGIGQIILISKGIPPLDMVQLVRCAEETDTLILGPNSPGLIVPDQLLLGTYPRFCFQPGSVGIISRSSTLTFEIAAELSQAGLGQSICVGLGSDAVIGSTFPQWLQILEEDDKTELIVLIGETGGESEEQAAAYIKEAIDKPVVAYISGRYVPGGTYIGHLGAIIASQAMASSVPTDSVKPPLGSADGKVAAMKAAKVAIASTPSEVATLAQKALQKSQRKTATPTSRTRTSTRSRRTQSSRAAASSAE